MNTDPLYDWGSLILSALLIVVFARVTWQTALSYRRHRDDRAAWSLLLALLKLVVAFGLTVSAFGLVMPHVGIGGVSGQTLALVGLSLVRGAMLVAGVALLLGARRLR